MFSDRLYDLDRFVRIGRSTQYRYLYLVTLPIIFAVSGSIARIAPLNFADSIALKSRVAKRDPGKPNPFDERRYRKVWDIAALPVIDPDSGGSLPELGDVLKPIDRFFTGKHDTHHAFQDCLIPLCPPRRA